MLDDVRFITLNKRSGCNLHSAARQQTRAETWLILIYGLHAIMLICEQTRVPVEHCHTHDEIVVVVNNVKDVTVLSC